MNMASSNTDSFTPKRLLSSGDICAALEDIKSILSLKINDLIIAMKTDFDAKIAALRVTFEEKLAESIKNKTTLIKEEIQKPSTTNDKIPVMNKYLSGIEKRLDKVEREENLNKLLISGIPMVENENIKTVITSVCNAIKYNRDPSSSIVHIYRPSRRNVVAASSSLESSHQTQLANPPIVITFCDFECKMSFFSCYLKTRLNISQIGFSASTRVYINEKLTTKNYEIFKKANAMKRDGNLLNFYTFRGLVFIRRHERSKAVCVCTLVDLFSLIT